MGCALRGKPSKNRLRSSCSSVWRWILVVKSSSCCGVGSSP
ncbi:Uncharacterised protein [Mycobacteroides abscessus subsp. abscessus]|nr:Uncharacterised protein [Mycobacteroides abscessus subsp. abscessus]